jgi:hypothetical protein
VATQRQIEANRLNAQKSTGPRSAVGLKKSSRNSLRHGLSKPLCGADFEEQLKALVLEIAEKSANETKLGLARVVAEAELDLQRIRAHETAICEQIMMLAGRPGSRELSQADVEAATRGLIEFRLPDITESSEERSGQLQDLLSELISYQRYEGRATARRDVAIRKINKLDADN